MENGQETINSKECYLVSFGENTPDNFVTYEHFYVSTDGKLIYSYDVVSDSYELLWSSN